MAGKNNMSIAIVVIVVGIVLIAGGIIMYLWCKRRRRARGIRTGDEVNTVMLAGDSTLDPTAGSQPDYVRLEDGTGSNQLPNQQADQSRSPSIAVIDPTNGQSIREVTKGMPLSLSEFDILSVLGEGTFGKVYLVRSKYNQRIFAMKVLKKERVRKEGQVGRTKAERNVLERLDHPFIVKLHGSFQTLDKLYFVLDYHEGGDMYFYISRHGRLQEHQLRYYACQIISALSYLHQHGVLYRDLKPENVLMSSQGHAILTDFGLCKDLETSANPTSKGKATAWAHSFVGTPEYLAPEVILGKAYGPAADFYALGVTLFELGTGQPPFYHTDRNKLYRRTLYGRINFPNYLSEACVSFLAGLLERNPAQRLGANGGADQLKSHPFFKGVNWSYVEACRYQPPLLPQQSQQNPLSLNNFEQRFTQMPLFSVVDKPNIDAVGTGWSNLGTDTSGAIKDKIAVDMGLREGKDIHPQTHVGQVGTDKSNNTETGVSGPTNVATLRPLVPSPKVGAIASGSNSQLGLHTIGEERPEDKEDDEGKGQGGLSRASSTSTAKGLATESQDILNTSDLSQSTSAVLSPTIPIGIPISTHTSLTGSHTGTQGVAANRTVDLAVDTSPALKPKPGDEPGKQGTTFAGFSYRGSMLAVGIPSNNQ